MHGESSGACHEGLNVSEIHRDLKEQPNPLESSQGLISESRGIEMVLLAFDVVVSERQVSCAWVRAIL